MKQDQQETERGMASKRGGGERERERRGRERGVNARLFQKPYLGSWS